MGCLGHFRLFVLLRWAIHWNINVTTGEQIKGRLVHFRLFVLLRVVSDPQEYKRNHRREQIKGQLQLRCGLLSPFPPLRPPACHERSTGI
jgi:hypothetical protein